jgi:hypothetical protein
VVEWFLPSRRELPPTQGPGSRTELKTELSDVSGGRVVVETRWLAEAQADTRWETTICPADDSDPDGAAAAVFAQCGSKREAALAHDQAVEFAANALNSTLRRPTSPGSAEAPFSAGARSRPAPR